MPYSRKRRFRKNRRRLAKRWRPRRMRRPTTVMTKQVFPNRYITKLRYHQNIKIDTGVSHIVTNFLFHANNINKPPVVAVDHQPMGHDNLAQIYAKWVVTSSKITCVFSNTSTVSAQMCSISTRDNTVQVTNADRLIENKNISYGVISTGDSGGNVRKLTKSFNAGSFLSVRDPTDDDSLIAFFNANPTQLVYYHIGVYALAEDINPAQVDVDVTIEYTIVAFEPVPMALS